MRCHGWFPGFLLELLMPYTESHQRREIDFGKG